MTALGLHVESHHDSVVSVHLNGVHHNFSVSDDWFTVQNGVKVECGFRGLNLLGMDYLDSINGVLAIDMSTNTVSLQKGEE